MKFLMELQIGFGPIVAKLSASMFHIRYTLGKIGMKPILIYERSKSKIYSRVRYKRTPLNKHTGCNSDIWKKVQVNILKEPLLVLKQMKHQRKALDFSFNMAP